MKSIYFSICYLVALFNLTHRKITAESLEWCIWVSARVSLPRAERLARAFNANYDLRQDSNHIAVFSLLYRFGGYPWSVGDLMNRSAMELPRIATTANFEQHVIDDNGERRRKQPVLTVYMSNPYAPATLTVARDDGILPGNRAKEFGPAWLQDHRSASINSVVVRAIPMATPPKAWKSDERIPDYTFYILSYLSLDIPTTWALWTLAYKATSNPQYLATQYMAAIKLYVADQVHDTTNNHTVFTEPTAMNHAHVLVREVSEVVNDFCEDYKSVLNCLPYPDEQFVAELIALARSEVPESYGDELTKIHEEWQASNKSPTAVVEKGAIIELSSVRNKI